MEESPMRRPRPVSTVLALVLALLAVPAVRGAGTHAHPPGVAGVLDADTTADSIPAERPALEAQHGSALSHPLPPPSVLRACARIRRYDLIRLHGDFGEFQGFASAIGPEGVDG